MIKITLARPDLLAFTRQRIEVRRSAFNIVKEQQGAGAALAAIASDLTTTAANAAARSGRRLKRLGDLAIRSLAPDRPMRDEVLFIGYIEACLGLGESLRGQVRSFAETGMPFALYPFKSGVEQRLIGAFMEEHYDLKHRHEINIIEMAADQVPNMFRELGRRQMARSYNILRTYWELPEAPASWASMLRGIHEIWAPNDFVARAFRGIFRGPIAIVPPCVEISARTHYDRQHFGLRDGIFWFMFSFDYFSSPHRKNPLGVVQAFQTAFPGGSEKVGLILKSTSTASQHPEFKSAIMDAAREDPRIATMDRTLTRDEMLSLINRIDCYVSLHRAEGFGLGMAEAMAMGKPVIGTNFSGSTTFLSEKTGFPVRYGLRAVQPSEYHFSAGQFWAEPDTAEAAESMRCVVRDRSERDRRAAAGKTFVETNFGRENVGRIMAERLRDVRLSIGVR